MPQDSPRYSKSLTLHVMWLLSYESQSGKLMFKDVNGQVVQVRDCGISELLKVVILQANGWANDFKFLIRKYDHQAISPEVIVRDCPNWDSRWLISQTFTAMVLEAFYYDYILEKESKGKAENKSSPVNRYVYIAETYLGQDNVRDSELYIELASLNLVRRVTGFITKVLK